MLYTHNTILPVSFCVFSHRRCFDIKAKSVSEYTRQEVWRKRDCCAEILPESQLHGVKCSVPHQRDADQKCANCSGSSQEHAFPSACRILTFRLPLLFFGVWGILFCPPVTTPWFFFSVWKTDVTDDVSTGYQKNTTTTLKWSGPHFVNCVL